jgi:hypothetical protein
MLGTSRVGTGCLPCPTIYPTVQKDLIGLQVHGGGKTVVAYKDLVLTQL